MFPCKSIRFYFQVEGDGDDAVVTSIEPPGIICQSICTLGRLLVLAGAIWKGRAEYNEMQSLGIKKYFQTTVKMIFALFLLFDNFFNRIGFGSSGKLFIVFILCGYLSGEYSSYI